MKKYRILVVEDEALIAASLVHTLSSLGYTVPEPVATGEDAIRAVKTKKPDLVLMDIVLIGEMDGITAAKKIQAIADVPVIYITAYTDDLRLKNARLTEPYGYIVKPAQSRELHATIEMALYKHALDRNLKESEAKYRTVFENTGTATVVVEESTIISLANKEFEQLTGFSKDDIEGKKSWTEFVVKEDLERMLAQHRLRRKNKKKALTHYEFRAVTKSGDIRDIYLSIDVIPGTKKSIASLLDITERKQAEKELKKSQIQLAEAMDLAHLVNWEFDVASGIFTFNDRFYTLYGTTAEREGGYQMPAEVYAREFVHPDEAGVVANEVQNAIHATDPDYLGQTEHRIIRSDGEVRHITVQSGITKDADGRTIKTHGANQDITERKKAEDALRKSKEFLNKIINSISDPIHVKDRQHRIVLINDASCRLFNLSREEIIGKTAYDLFARREMADISWQNDEETFMTGKESVSEETNTYAPGKTLTVLVKKSLHTDTAGNQFLVGITTDITERKRTEERLKTFNEELERGIVEHTARLNASLEEKVVLLREIHHRVRNNLQIILSLIRLQSRNIKDQKILETMGEFQNRIMAMAHVHERMYRAEDISRIDLSEIVTFLGASLFSSYNVNPRHIRLNVEIKDLLITLDTAIPLSLIFNELISNSIKHAFVQDATGEITIAGHRDGDTLVLSFKDTGIGIPKDLDWMRTDQTLGLKLVVGLVQQLNGTIDLDRTAGTAFTIVVRDRE
jgi:PAS domain S-box-containing protein